VDDVFVPFAVSRFATTHTPSFTFGYSIVFMTRSTLTNAIFWLLNGQLANSAAVFGSAKNSAQEVAMSAFGP
jgi:hypothetical protein